MPAVTTWVWLLTLPSWENKSPSPIPYLSVQLICANPGMSLLIGSLVLQTPGFYLPRCHHLVRLPGKRRGRGSQQQPLHGQLCWPSLAEGQSVPAMCTAHRSVGQVRKRVQEPRNKGLSLMAIHCPQLKPSITPLPPAAGWASCLPAGPFLSLVCPGALDGCLFKAISS